MTDKEKIDALTRDVMRLRQENDLIINYIDAPATWQAVTQQQAVKWHKAIMDKRKESQATDQIR